MIAIVCVLIALALGHAVLEIGEKIEGLGGDIFAALVILFTMACILSW